jgi:heme-degrading monooxygenase HmoA
MVVVANRIFVAAAHAEAFEDLFRTRARLVDRMAGFLGNQVLRPLGQGDPYVILTLWETRRNFETWIRSEEFVQGHARAGALPKDAFTAPAKVEVFEVLQRTGWLPTVVAPTQAPPE